MVLESIAAAIAIGGAIGYGIYRDSRQRAYIRNLNLPADAFYRDYWWYTHFIISMPGAADKHWQKCLLLITHKRLSIYVYPQLEPTVTIMPHELQGFWRPEKYHPGDNEMWIHAQIGLTWHILQLKMWKTSMQRVVRAMKQISTDEQTKAYRRHRPYIHRGPAPAHPAQQTIHGSWELEAPLQLYVMPLSLVIFRGSEVERVLPLADIQNIAALRRMEGGEPAGLVRFTLNEESFAFAMNDYEAWAADLAEAAKRTLEEPVIRKGKGKDDEDE